MYAVLHAHTDKGSVGDSVLKIRDYVTKAKQMGLTHIAITDHGSMASMVEFHEECKKAGITGIIGMEAYVVPDRLKKSKEEKRGGQWHLVLLAKNRQGVKDLLRIHNDAQINGYYYVARTDLTMLKQYGKNMIALSACVGGEIPQHILHGDLRAAAQAIRAYRGCFAGFYLEIQPGHFEEQTKVNDMLVRLSEASGVPLVATNDIHYLNRQDYIMHDLHVKSGRKEDGDSSLVYPDTCYYLMDEQELCSSFLRTEYVTDEAIRMAVGNTNAIAAQCDGEVEYGFAMPHYPDLPDGETEESCLVKLCQKELRKRLMYIRTPAVYEERLQYELDVIIRLGFAGYFLVMKDFLDHARATGNSVGPGRGSVGGSLVAWLLDITVADPVKNNLMFERFLNPFRKGAPDIDVDFKDPGAAKAYVIEKYGFSHCALVGTYGMRLAKDAIRTAGRLLNMDLGRVDEVCAAAPLRINNDEGEKIPSPTIDQMVEASAKFRSCEIEFPELFRLARSIESFPKSYGIHAAGIVITPGNILEMMPVRVDEDKKTHTKRLVSMIDKNYIEHVCLKYDFLSLATQAIVDQTIRDTGAEVDLNDDEFYNDKAVWDAIGSPNTIGMFQISSNLYRKRMPLLHPATIQELAACLALIRGPCISAGTDQTYIDIVNGKHGVVKIDPRYDEVTKDTHGICIYQEEIMLLAQAYGMTVQESDKLRKAISKKKVDQIASLRDIFIADARACGTPDDTIRKLWKVIGDAGKYSLKIIMQYVKCFPLLLERKFNVWNDIIGDLTQKENGINSDEEVSAA